MSRSPPPRNTRVDVPEKRVVVCSNHPATKIVLFGPLVSAVKKSVPGLTRRAVQLAVPVVAAVGDARSGGAGALGADSLDRALDAALVEGQSEVVVGAQQDGVAAMQHTFGGRQHGVEVHVERIGAGAAQRVEDALLGRVLGENGHQPLLRNSSIARICVAMIPLASQAPRP